jgi:hypothetical protein
LKQHSRGGLWGWTGEEGGKLFKAAKREEGIVGEEGKRD